MGRVTRTLAVVLSLVGLLAGGLAIPVRAGAATVPPLDARLGGTQKSFAASFGDPVKDKSSADLQVYSVSGFGLVAAAFSNSKAYEVTIAADRLSHKPYTEPDDADWTVNNAARFADAVVPTDSTYGQPTTSKTQIEIVGHSAALAKAFTQKNYTTLQVAGKPGDFDVIYHLDTAGNVFSVDVSLGNGQTVAAPTSTSTKSGNATTSSSGNSTASGNVVHCKDFQSQADAQAYFDAHGGDSNPSVSGMDGDKDGKPCENLP